MIAIVSILLLLAAVALPGLWVKRVLKKYSEPADRYREQGTGAELARHLLDSFDLQQVAVEITPDGDHYDPQAKAVRLTQDKYDGCSLRIGIITGLFDRKFEYRIRSVACLFDESV